MKLFVAIFSGVGLVMLSVSGFLFYQETHFLADAQVGQGTVIDLQRSESSKGGATYYPVVSYTTRDGKVVTFSSGVSTNPPSYEVGESVEVYYDPQNPNGAEIKGFFSQWFVVLIFGGLGLIFTSIGAGVGLSRSLRNKKNQWLKVNGTPVEATIQSVELNTSFKVNGKSPYVIYTQWLNPETGKVHVFKSESIWYNPSDYLPGETLPVYVDRRNLKSYYVDLSFLPQLSR
jgi:hypothetical protein